MIYFKFLEPQTFLGRLKVVIKFYIQVKYVKYYPRSNRLPPNGRGQGQVTHLLILVPIISLKSLKLGTSNFVS